MAATKTMSQNDSPLPKLRLSLLGSPRVTLDDEVVFGFISSKAQALLFYVAMEEGIHARQDLAVLLWPDSTEQRSLKNLRDVLTNLRRLVGDYLDITWETVALRRDVPHWLDVEVFSEATAGQHLTADADTLTAALRLYRGDFLGSFYIGYAPEFEQWADSVREQLRLQAIKGLQTLAEHHLAAGDFATGLDVNGRLLNLEPWYEAGHRQRMRLLTLSGQRTAALRQYEECRDILASEFGIEPLSETNELADAIAAGALDPPAERPLSSPDSTSVPSAARAAPPGNLPRVLTPFFGRTEALAEIVRKVQDPNYPLVTIVGQGGVGKTRLALAAAAQVQQQHHFSDGIWFVDLAYVTLRDEDIANAVWDNLATAVAYAMQLPFRNERSLSEQLFEVLRQRHCLLILDNFEQLVDAAPFVLQLLDAAQQAQILITSRAELPLRAAWVYRLGGLPLPSAKTTTQVENAEKLVARFAALQMFAERASRRHPEFTLSSEVLPDVIAICRLVAGLPLGIELAAATLRRHSVRELVAQLERRLDLLTDTPQDVPLRQHSLQATFETSWQLLDRDARRALALCTVFRGSFAAEDAEALTGAAPGVLESLSRKSLLQAVAPRRYQMNIVLRHCALTKLATQPEDEEEIERRHGRYYTQFLHAREERMLSDPAAIQEVRAELDNVRAAWTWACRACDLTALEAGLRTLSDTYQWSGLFHAGGTTFAEAKRVVRAALDAGTRPAADAQRLLGLLVLELSFFAERLGDIEGAAAYAREAVRLGEQLDHLYMQATGSLRLAALEWRLGNLAGMRTMAEKGLALAERGGLARQQTVAHIGLGLLAMAEHDLVGALRWLNAAQRLAESYNQLRFASTIHLNLGLAQLEVGELAASMRNYERSAELHARFDDQNGAAVALLGTASILVVWGQCVRAETMLKEIRERLARNQDRYYLSIALRTLAASLLGQERYAAARRAGEEALRLARDSDFHPDVEYALLVLGEVLAAQGQMEAAREAFAQVFEVEPTWATFPVRQYARASLADLMLQQGDIAGALAEVEQILPGLEERPFNPYYRSAEVYLVCYQVLQKAGDPRARALLESASATIQRIAAMLPDDATRSSYLEKVAANRRILALSRS